MKESLPYDGKRSSIKRLNEDDGFHSGVVRDIIESRGD
jgi:hypothetical protein